ncbi:glycolipid 2-alpha-mannosyltransferase-domain-containing protein [Cristinia sonorae]|uniref:Glycolipid 2-alpha-mannosyltransferase-domain-containing protein n=1 Tax=Cristinia sonorae TaxID=1940300 RepID=A0A8K0XTA7_9AGAR|nr:glycolipid 2-alpha-mannosyltransferase-domain-containing protein [Cristinia sonorae]
MEGRKTRKFADSEQNGHVALPTNSPFNLDMSPTKLGSFHPSRRLYLFFLITSAIIITTWLIRNGSEFDLSNMAFVDERYGVVIDSEEYWQQGKFVNHGLDLIPTFDAHHSVLKDIPTDKLGYNAVVLYLISFNRLRDVILSLSFLHKNVPMQPWPIVLFHTDDMDDSVARDSFMLHLYDELGTDEKAKQFMQRIEFVRLDNWSLPPGFPTDKNVVKPSFSDSWPGYHIMCGFFASQIFDHPRLQDVTYYLRLDTDSYIYKPVCYDPIDLLHTKKKVYGFRSPSDDPPYVTEGMWELTDRYSRQHPEIRERLNQNRWVWPEGLQGNYPTYYNNFEVVKLAEFRRPEVKRWLEEIMKDPYRIYKHRWGDAPIRFTTVNMFFDVEKDVENYCAVPYWHNGPARHVCSCEDQLSGR